MVQQPKHEYPQRPEVHADQHGLYFRPNDSQQAIVVNDGGLAFVGSSDRFKHTKFTEMEGNFVTTQFCRGKRPGFTEQTWFLRNTRQWYHVR